MFKHTITKSLGDLNITINGETLPDNRGVKMILMPSGPVLNTNISAFTGPRGKGIASTNWDEANGLLTITYTDNSVEILDLSIPVGIREDTVAAAAVAAAAASSASEDALDAQDAKNAAGASQIAASNSEAVALDKANEAAVSATNAAAVEDSVEFYAENAESSATSAAQSEASSTAARDDIEAVYIGKYVDDAAADLSGKPISEGVFYFKTTTPKGLRLNTGTEWIAVPTETQTYELKVTAQENLGGHRVITAAGFHATEATLDQIVGISTAATVVGQKVSIKSIGFMSEPSWTWTPGQPLFVTGAGVLTQTPPTGTVRRIAWAISATEINVDLFPTIQLA